MDKFGRKTTSHRLAPWASLLLLASCSSLIGIEDPVPRSEGEGGSDADGAGASDSSRNGAGEAGAGGKAGSGDLVGIAASGGGNEGVAGNAGDGGGGIGGTDSPGECQPNAARCDVYQAEHCVDGHWQKDDAVCPLACVDGECQDPPSCAIEGASPPCVDGVSCCETIWVPGGTYTMGRHNEFEPEWVFERTVSGFYLDRFEVTVGRMRAFTSDYQLPKAGAGAHPLIANSGWQEAWEELPHPDLEGLTLVPKTFEELLEQLSEQCAGTWGNGSLLPVSCVNWYVAFAFCAWDGGRLPTEAEWNFAAAYGAAERPYPWSADETDFAISATNTAYWDGDTVLVAPAEVGSYPSGRGGFFRYPGRGHDDLAGNLFEWTLDAWSDSPAASCSDCSEPWSEVSGDRVARGGSFGNSYDQALTGNRALVPAEVIDVITGFRCARDMYTHPE